MKYVRNQAYVVRMIFFLTYVASAAWSAYFYIYLENEVELKGYQVGTIAALQQIIVIVVVPFWGILADKYGRKNTLTLSILFTAACLLVFLWQGSFWFYLSATFLLMLVVSPVNSLSDSLALDFIIKFKRHSFGNLRLWASLGWAVSAFTLGLVLKELSLKWIFPLASLLFLITAAIVYFSYKPAKVTSTGLINWRNVYHTFVQNRFLLLFFGILLVYGIASPPTFLFINVYLNAIGATPDQIGAVFAIQSISELPFFFYGQQIIDRIGARKIFLISIAATGAKFYLFSVIDDPVVVMMLSPIHGIAFGLFMLSIIQIVQQTVPEHFKSTAQSLIYAVFFGAGMAIGNFLMGSLKDEIGMQQVMFYDTGLVLLVMVGYLTFFYLDKRKKVKPHKRIL